MKTLKETLTTENTQAINEMSEYEEVVDMFVEYYNKLMKKSWIANTMNKPYYLANALNDMFKIIYNGDEIKNYVK